MRDPSITDLLRSANKFPVIFARTNRFKNSFICYGLANYQWHWLVFYCVIVWLFTVCMYMYCNPAVGCHIPINRWYKRYRQRDRLSLAVLLKLLTWQWLFCYGMYSVCSVLLKQINVMWCDDRFVINSWAFSCLSLAECPSITMEALGGMKCSNNGETVLMHPGPLAFSCVYELQSTTTNYKWFLDDNDTKFTTSSVNISIPSGSHNVTVTTFINVTDYLRTLGLPDQYSEECSSCNDTRTIAVTVVGKYQQMVCYITGLPSLNALIWNPKSSFDYRVSLSDNVLVQQLQSACLY